MTTDRRTRAHVRQDSDFSLLRKSQDVHAPTDILNDKFSQTEHDSRHLDTLSETSQSTGIWIRISAYLRTKGVETTGIKPTRPDDRTQTQLYRFFLFWFSTTMNIISFCAGSVGPTVFSLGLWPTFYTCLAVDLIFFAVPSYLAVFGPKLGMRSMVHARYSWGYYGAKLPSILNALSLQGFLVLNCILGGQSISSVSDKLDATLGIVIIAIISLILSFCGGRVLQIYQNMAWTLCIMAFVAMIAAPGNVSHLMAARLSSQPIVPAKIVSFGSYVASSALSWCTMAPDHGVHFSANSAKLLFMPHCWGSILTIRSIKVFGYTYLGLVSSSLLGQTLGAAFASAAPFYAPWSDGYRQGKDIGGLFGAILSPLGRFGQFLTVVLALTMCSPSAATMYSFSASLMTVGEAFGKVPRYVYSVVSTAILIPVAIVGATRLYTVLVNILGFVGYWLSIHVAIILTEHVCFRQRNFAAYDLREWNQPSRLSWGVPGILSFLLGVGIIIPSMRQVWYTGPIAKAGAGDIGVLTGSVVAGGCFWVLRCIEQKGTQRRNTDEER